MKLSTKKISMEMDRRAIEEFSIPGLTLMENAGRAAAAVILSKYPCAEKIAVVCGSGNNGGDGFVVARHLRCAGKDVVVYLTEKKEQYRADARINLDSLLLAETPVKELSGKNPPLKNVDVVVDAIFGTGLSRKVSGFHEKLIKSVNRASAPPVCLDIPSGLCADSGRPMGTAVRAETTVTFATPKLGMCVYPGVDYVGDLYVADITVPKILEKDIPFELLTFKKCAGLLRERAGDSHKGTYGHLLVLAGSPGKSGAAVLCASAALRAGSGLVTLGVPKSIFSAVEEKTVEVMSAPLDDCEDGTISPEAYSEVTERLSAGKTTWAIGPGMSTSPATAEFLEKTLKRCRAPVVLDADALNIISKNPASLGKIKAPVVITPHPKEMSRLCGITTKDVQNNRVGICSQFARKHSCHVVLKGARTVISCPSGKTFINPTGNPTMATAGTGDVLTGVIGGLLSQGYRPQDACSLGVFLHGHAADLLFEETETAGFTASDISRKIPASRNSVASATEEKHFTTVR